MAGDASHARGTAETRQRSFWRDLGRGPLVRGTAHALRDILRAVRLLGRAAVERDALRRSALVEKAAVQLRLIGGETERELRRLQRALSVPATPRLLGERLKGQKVLWLGPCHIEALAEFGREVGCRGEHLLFTSLPHEAPEFSGAGHDAVVVGFNLTYLLLGLPGGGKPSLVHLHPDWTEATAEESLALCKSAIEGFLRHFVEKAEGAPLFVSAILEPSFDYMGVLNKERGPSHFPTFVRRLNEIIRAALRPESNCHFLDINEIVNSVGRFHLTDDIHMFSARASFIADGDVEPDIEAGRLVAPVPPSTTYSMDRRWRMTCEVVWERVLDGIKIIRQIDAVKLIIVDLDDTLWRGVAAEGERDTYFRTVAWPTGFVEALLYFRKRGGLLAICSKNDEAPTRERFAAIWRDMIRLDDFVSVKINWLPKSENVAQILAETNLLPGNVVFVDDNPREVDEVRARFPAIRSLGFQHYDWRRIVLQAPEMQVATVTAESLARTELVRARVAREASQAQGVDRAGWLRSLELKAKIAFVRSCGDQGFARAFELINKTNQFNTNGRRWTRAQFELFFARGGVCLTAALRDRTVDNGVIGVLLLDGAELVQAVLSCRVFGLGAELALGAVATELALETGAKAFGTIVATDKNLACRDFFKQLGYEATDAGGASRPGRRRSGRTGSRSAWADGLDHADGEPVPAFCAHGLERGGGPALFARCEREEFARPHDVGPRIRRVEDGALAHDIVHHDGRAHARKFQRPIEVGGVVFLVGVDEDQVELLAFRLQGGQQVQRGADAQVHLVRHVGGREIPARDGGVIGREFERHHLAALGQGAGEPDGGIAAQRSDFENAPRPGGAREHVQEFALRRGNVDARQAGGAVGRQRLVQRGVVRQQFFLDVGVHRAPVRIAHARLPCVGA